MKKLIVSIISILHARTKVVASLLTLVGLLGLSPLVTVAELQEPDCECYDINGDPIDSNPIALDLKQEKGKPLRGIADIHTHMFANLAYGGATLWGYPYHEEGISKALASCDRTRDFRTYNIAEHIRCSLGTDIIIPWPLWPPWEWEYVPCTIDGGHEGGTDWTCNDSWVLVLGC